MEMSDNNKETFIKNKAYHQAFGGEERQEAVAYYGDGDSNGVVIFDNECPLRYSAGPEYEYGSQCGAEIEWDKDNGDIGKCPSCRASFDRSGF